MRRVVVSGMGVVSPVGNTVAQFWDSLIAGRNGVDNITRFDTSNYKVKVAAEVKNFDASVAIDANEQKKCDLYTKYALVAAQEAVLQSGIVGNVDPFRLGVYIGSGIGGINTLTAQQDLMRQSGPRRVSPYLVPMMIPNIAGGLIAIKYAAKGVNVPIVTACATATHGIGEAYRAIQYGYADAIIAGGAESPITEIALAGFANMMALSPNPDPSSACRPFDSKRDGFVIGEGAGILVLEEYEHAKARKATIFAEIVGYGNTCDAYHMTAPSPNAECTVEAIRQAYQQAKVSHNDRVYINAHGTSTPLNDKTETSAIKQVFKEQASSIAMSSTKSMHGHMLGATGGVEAIASINAIRYGIIPPTINYHNVDSECDLDYVPNQARRAEVDVALSTSLGFGGHNAVIAFRGVS